MCDVQGCSLVHRQHLLTHALLSRRRGSSCILALGFQPLPGDTDVAGHQRLGKLGVLPLNGARDGLVVFQALGELIVGIKEEGTGDPPRVEQASHHLDQTR